jgi:hypothetical protein
MSTNYSDNFVNRPMEQPREDDPFRPMQLVETTKDAIVLELRQFFASAETSGRLRGEIPTIEKYQIAALEKGEDSYIQEVNVLRQLPDISQKLPLVAITVATGRSRMLGFATQYVGVVQECPRLETIAGPWVMPQNAQIAFKTNAGITTITFTEVYVNDFSKVTPIELARAINNQTDRLIAKVLPDHRVRISLKTPNLEFIEVMAVLPTNYSGTVGQPTTPHAPIVVDGANYHGVSVVGATESGTASIGFAPGLRDDIYNPDRPPKHRYQTAKDLTVNIDLGADDDNQRTELTDLLSYFFELRLEERDFHISGNTEKGQNYQIVFKNELTLGGESEIPRPEGDGFDKIYVNRISIPVTVVDYVDREGVRISQMTMSDGIPVDADEI